MHLCFLSFVSFLSQDHLVSGPSSLLWWQFWHFNILWTSYYSPLMTYENGIEVNIICQMSNSLTFIYALLHEAGIPISFFLRRNLVWTTRSHSHLVPKIYQEDRNIYPFHFIVGESFKFSSFALTKRPLLSCKTFDILYPIKWFFYIKIKLDNTPLCIAGLRHILTHLFF